MNEPDLITLTVNGQTYQLPEIPGEMLSDLLRYRLKLTGTKVACGEAECGACTVILNGEPVLSCSFPAAKANGATILTIEGLSQIQNTPAADGGKIPLHPLQHSFIEYGAVQCGFCIPGQIMTSYALLQRNPDPSEEDIKYALKDTLCRCAGYPTIINAIKAAAKTMRTGQPVERPRIPVSSHAQRVVGKIQPRPDAVAKVTGKAIYTDDIQFENMLHARVKRAGVASGILRSINVEKARQLTGVVAVLTAKDLPAERYHGRVINEWPV